MTTEPRFDPYTGQPVTTTFYPPAELKFTHSGPGIASLVMGLALALLVFCVFILAGVVEANTPGGMDEESPIAIVIGLFILACMVGMLAGMILGIVGAVQGNRKKGMAVAGILINGLFLLGTAVFIVIGLAVS